MKIIQASQTWQDSQSAQEWKVIKPHKIYTLSLKCLGYYLPSKHPWKQTVWVSCVNGAILELPLPTFQANKKFQGRYNKYITGRPSQDSMAQSISNYKSNRYKDTHQEAITWQKLYTNMNKTN